MQNEIQDGGRQSIIESVLSCVSIPIFIEIGGSVQKLRALECRHHMPVYALSRKMSKSDPPSLGGTPLIRNNFDIPKYTNDRVQQGKQSCPKISRTFA